MAASKGSKSSIIRVNPASGNKSSKGSKSSTSTRKKSSSSDGSSSRSRKSKDAGGSSDMVHVEGHMTKKGTYVPAHLRSKPDGDKYNNRGVYDRPLRKYGSK